MLSPSEITGVVLAGGKSSRFGSNKALSQFDGKSFLLNSIEILKPFSKEVVVSGNYSEYDELEIPVLEDVISGIGSVGGILTALRYSSTAWILVLTCDMPLITPEIIGHMLRANSRDEIIGWSRDGNGGQFPLLVSKNALPFIKHNIEKKRYRVKQLFDLENSLQLAIPEKWRRHFANINTLNDYKEITACTQ